MSYFIDLKSKGFRNLKNDQKISFSPKLNFIFGENASGKTNLLEALYLFSHSNSFRFVSYEQLINYDDNEFFLFAHIKNNQNKDQKLGVYKNELGETKLKVQGEKAQKYSDLAMQIAIKTLSSEKGNLLDTSPKLRRAEIDWQLFHAKHQNLEWFSELNRILKQKSTLLKNNSLNLKQIKEQLEPWNYKLANLSKRINIARKQALEAIEIKLKELIEKKHFSFLDKVKIELYSGYPKNLDITNESKIDTYLNDNIVKEKLIGQCLYGPQRADILFTHLNKNSLAKDFYSRGQKKIYSLYFSLAQLKNLNDLGQKAVLCLDDLHAEIDRRNFNILIDLISSLGNQFFITIPLKSFAAMKKYGQTMHIKSGEIY